jgi:hypothetical protein
MEDKIKNVLYAVYKLDQVSNRFNNKFKYMNLNLPLNQADRWDEAKLDQVVVALNAVYNALKNIPELIDGLEEPVLDLIKSYAE